MRPVTIQIFILFLFTAVACAAGPSTSVTSMPPAAPAKKPFGWNLTMALIPKDLKVEDNIVYKTVNGQELKLTMFYPKVNKYAAAPLVVYIHGGGWSEGNRFVIVMSGGISVMRALNDAGVVGATIEYRLISPHGSNAMDAAADCKDAIHFLVKNAQRFGIDPNRIATMGGSAGGHLSLVTALGDDKDYPCDPDLAAYQGKILAEVADFPLVSLVDKRVSKAYPGVLLGGPLDQKHAEAEKLSPTLLVKAGSPAIFLAHGDHDRILTVQNSITLAAVCHQKGVPCELVIVKNADHGFRGTNIDPSQDEINRRTVAFLLKYLLPAAPSSAELNWQSPSFATERPSPSFVAN